MFPSDIQSSLGEVVRRRRTALGFSQEDFAAHVDLHRTYIGGFERGERNLTLANLSAVAQGLGVPLSTLIIEAEADISGGELPDRPQIVALYDELPPNRRDLLVEMAIALGCDVESEILAGSDICTEVFAGDFQNRLVLFHAMNDEPLKKKTFEYAFVRSMKTDGRDAVLENNPVNPGTDATVDGVSYSLKTEAAKGIKRENIMISKLMEARWIRGCSTPDEFASGIRNRVIPHLEQYERILTLRAFRGGSSNDRYEYHLVEIPLDLLLQVRNLSPADFKERTSNGSTSADVVDSSGNRRFSLRLDGSVEKVTISNLAVSECTIHGTWKVQALNHTSPESNLF